MGVKETLCCPTCGYDSKPSRFGLDTQGTFNVGNYDRGGEPHEMTVRVDHFGGRANIWVERVPMSAQLALGMYASVKATLARIKAELRAAGIEPED